MTNSQPDQLFMMLRKPQLFLLHFAGGSINSFEFLSPLLKEFDIIPLELPGRGKRMKEPLLRDFDSAAWDIYKQILARVSNDFIIYGHSMGASLSLRVTNLLEKNGWDPLYLVVSGNSGPGRTDDRNIHLLAHDEFREKLIELEGTHDDVFENKELFDFYEPILRADFELVENKDLTDEPPVKAPIYAVMGTQEETVDEILNWSKFTSSDFDYKLLEGGHFFIHKYPQKVADIINKCYKSRFL